MTRSHLVGCVLLPFAAGYYLSYLFRTINALIATDLTAEFGLSAADLGLLTSVYFLVFAAAQLPFGVLLDRHGPRTIQSALLLLASAGALVFALADSLTGLIVGRAMIGLGVALALMAGFKAIVLWFPPERVALVNGWFVMLGALGAVTATAPAEIVVQVVGWRGLFALLGGLSAVAAVLVLLLVPECSLPKPKPGRSPLSLWAIYRDRRFWRLAPLSALGVGTSWSLQGLWAAPWLKDVDGLDRDGVVQMLGIMAIAVSASGLSLGIAADRLRPHGIRTHQVLAATLGIAMLAQILLVVGSPVPAILPWALIAAAGAATVLSYATLAEYFPKEASGRANAALNILHVGCAFAIQCVTGLIIEQWAHADGHYPVDAHRCALAVMLMLQVVALAWFCLAPLRMSVARSRQTLQSQLVHYMRADHTYATTQIVSPLAAPVPTSGWRAATAASVLVSLVLLGCLTLASGHVIPAPR
ncbi:MAG: MFS transporter [Hyphomonadaceae bacterium]|nr:MFS transporter [Hyphomonadaceae bacterium]